MAAKALGVKPCQVPNYVADGELECRAEGNGVNKPHFVPLNSVNELREKRNTAGKNRGKSVKLPRPPYMLRQPRKCSKDLP